MRNNNEYPVTVLADKDTPFKKNWNNYTSIGWTFCGHYQAADGVTDSSDLALPIQAYVFHGQYYFMRTIRGTKIKDGKAPDYTCLASLVDVPPFPLCQRR